MSNLDQPLKERKAKIRKTSETPKPPPRGVAPNRIPTTALLQPRQVKPAVEVDVSLSSTIPTSDVAVLSPTPVVEADKVLEGQQVELAPLKPASKVSKSPPAEKPKRHNPTNGVWASNYAVNSTMDVTPFKYIKMDPIDGQEPYEILDLETGFRLVYSPDDKDYIIHKKVKAPLFLSANQRKVYFAIIGVIIYVYDRQDRISEEILRLTEASVYLAPSDSPYPVTVLPDIKMLLGSTTELVYFFWTHFKSSGCDIFVVGDNLKTITLTVFTESVPPYREITPLEASQLVNKFLSELFQGVIPQKFQEKFFIEGFIDHICLHKAISTKEFETKIELTGVPFQDYFAQVEYLADDIKLLPYSKEVFTTQKVVKANYLMPVFKNNTIMLSRDCKTFLENLTCNDPYKYSVLRGFIRAMISAKQDGDSFQSAIWLHGPPACSKSLWVKVFKKMLREEEVAEMAHGPNQFSGSTLDKVKLIVASDVTNFSGSFYKLLKPLLGRDGLRGEKKHVQNVEIIRTKAVIVFVSNFAPTDISFIKSDLAVLEKLIVVEFPPEATIPPELQVPNMEDLIERFIPEIFNWAIYAPVSVLRYLIRATSYNNYRMRRTEIESIGGLAGFLRDNYMYSSDPDAFVSIVDLRTHMAQHQEISGDDILKAVVKGEQVKDNNAQLAAMVTNVLRNNFARSATYQRYSKRDRGNTRPMGIKGLIPKPAEGQPIPEKAEYLEFKFEKGPELKLDDPFYAQQRICWLRKEHISDEAFTENQNKIKEHRQALLNEGSNPTFPLTEEVPKKVSTLETPQVASWEDSFFKNINT